MKLSILSIIRCEGCDTKRVTSVQMMLPDIYILLTSDRISLVSNFGGHKDVVYGGEYVYHNLAGTILFCFGHAPVEFLICKDGIISRSALNNMMGYEFTKDFFETMKDNYKSIKNMSIREFYNKKKLTQLMAAFNL